MPDAEDNSDENFSAEVAPATSNNEEAENEKTYEINGDDVAVGLAPVPTTLNILALENETSSENPFRNQLRSGRAQGRRASQARRVSLSVAYDIPHEEFMEINLGYTVLYVLPAQLNKPRVKVLLACCPCLYAGLSNAFQTFWKGGLFRKFIIIVSFLEVLLFAIEIIVNGGFESADVNPLLGPSACTIQRMQARYTSAIVNHKQLWRLIVPIFLHGGVIHLALNIYSQLCVGIVSEYKWGSGRLFFAYLVTGTIGNLVSALGNPNTLSVGASGAIMGITGWQAAYILVTWPHAEPNYRNAEVTGIVVALLCLVIIGAALPSRIDNWTHGGGFVSGVLLGLAQFRKYCLTDTARLACFAAGCLVPIAAALLLAYLFSTPVGDVPVAGCPLFPST